MLEEEGKMFKSTINNYYQGGQRKYIHNSKKFQQRNIKIPPPTRNHLKWENCSDLIISVVNLMRARTLGDEPVACL